MNPIIDAIMKRRSIRKYTDQPVSREDIETVLKAGIYAPTGGDAEPWHFGVLTDRKTIDDLDERGRKAMSQSGIERIVAMGTNPKYRLFFGAPVVIMIYGEKVLRKTGTHLSALADCSAAIQNMQLAAYSLGLGTCWIGLMRYLFATDRCFAPEGFDPLYAMTLGYSAGAEALRPRSRMEDVITWF
ncbi:MAG: nitroreductase family protein [Aminivibrio sp.]